MRVLQTFSVLLLAFASSSLSAQKAASAPDIPFDSVSNFLKLPPNPEGQVVMLLGRRPEPPDAGISFTPPAPGANPGPYAFDGPTDVAWRPAGDIFVSVVTATRAS